jgi:hypothetical protein
MARIRYISYPSAANFANRIMLGTHTIEQVSPLRDKATTEAHVSNLIIRAIDQDPERYLELLKHHLLDELMYRVVAHSYFD